MFACAKTVAMLTRSIPLPFALDLRRTLGPFGRGRGDPTFAWTGGRCWRATRTPDGAATTSIGLVGSTLEAEAWGLGAERALDSLPRLVGAEDRGAEFRPDHPVIASLHRRFEGMRIGRSDAVMEALVASILEQKVTSFEARRAYRQIVLTYGERAPGPPGLLLPPDPATLASLAYYDLHVLGVERKRADTIRRACARAHSLDALVDLTPEDASARLMAVPGIGRWTAAEVTAVAMGDPDAVPVGDYHVPSLVTWALAGERRGTDAHMLELLTPFAGNRGRVIRLLGAGGLAPPRRGPRLAPRHIARL